MPHYDFRCRTCGAVFEERRAMVDADAPATCPDGHVGAARLLPVFAATGRAGSAADGGFAGGCGAPVAGGCGARCGCHAG
ncbi:MAG: zinc ribbon domain-containing protein [Acidimicrobiales bacterium]